MLIDFWDAPLAGTETLSVIWQHLAMATDKGKAEVGLSHFQIFQVLYRNVFGDYLHKTSVELFHSQETRKKRHASSTRNYEKNDDTRKDEKNDDTRKEEFCM
eukprot:g62063.t1